MDQFQEDRLESYRRIERIVRSVEESEAKKNQAMQVFRRQAEASKTGLGPANDLLRLMYLLQQQRKNDSDEIIEKVEDNLLEYLKQYQPVVEVEPEEEEEEETPVVPPVTPIEPVARPQIEQPPIAPQIQPSVPVPQPPAPTPITTPSDNLVCIQPHTLAEHQKIAREASQYEEIYSKVDAVQKRLLLSRIKGIMNKLRKETFDDLKRDLIDFLNGQEQSITGQAIRVSSDAERLLCLSLLATLILAQLLGGDLTDIKNEIFLPLVGNISELPRHKEFSAIFLDRLYKKCPYTIPSYPERQPTMTDKQYLEAMGYVEKPDGDQRRLETETEFLNRMNGLIRLFCKLLVRGGPPFDADCSIAWRWIADVLNLPPRPNITAVLLRVFLDEAGLVMLKTYQTQFPKLVTLMETQYLHRLESQTTPDQMSRLRHTLTTWRQRS